MAQFVLPHNLGLRRCVGITNVSQSLKPSIQTRSGLVQKPTTDYLHVLNKLKAHNNVTFHVVHMLLIMHRTVQLRNNDPLQDNSHSNGIPKGGWLGDEMSELK